MPPSAYTSLVDAVTGDVLVRRNQVDNAAYNNVFSGALTGTECGPRHAFELTDDLTRSINAVAVALPVDDVTLKVWGPGDTLLGTYDLGHQPGRGHLHRRAIPAGTYSVQVCPFDARRSSSASTPSPSPTSDTAAPTGGQVGFEPRWRYFPANPTLDSPTETPDQQRRRLLEAAAGEDCDTPPGELADVAAFGPWDNLAAGLVHLHDGRQQRQHPRGVAEPAEPRRPAPGAGLADPRLHARVHRRVEQLRAATPPSSCPAATTSTRR